MLTASLFTYLFFINNTIEFIFQKSKLIIVIW